MMMKNIIIHYNGNDNEENHHICQTCAGLFIRKYSFNSHEMIQIEDNPLAIIHVINTLVLMVTLKDMMLFTALGS